MRRGACLILWLAIAACGDDAGEQCVQDLSLDCTASIPTNFGSIYDKALAQNCGSGSGSLCHGQDGRQGGGLSMVDPDSTYDNLLGVNGRARVVPGDPGCSLLVERIESNDPNYRMPLAQMPLDPGLRCAIEKWIAAGAERD